MTKGRPLTQAELKERAALSLLERPRPKDDPIGYGRWWRARTALGLPTKIETSPRERALRRTVYLRDKQREQRREKAKGKSKAKRTRKT